MTIKVIAYTYEAAEHCIACSRERFADGLTPVIDTDENSIAFGAKDSEGNQVHPVFNCSETPADIPLSAGGRSLICDTCREVIKEHNGTK